MVRNKELVQLDILVYRRHHDKIRDIAFKRKVTMSQLIRELIENLEAR